MDDLRNILGGTAVLSSHLADVDCPAAAGFVPKTKHTVGYIVCAVLFNDCGQVLMIQEAKASCHGKWYLPAGRLEPGESLLEGVKREVLEESGFTFDPNTLLCIDFGRGSWYRITFTGQVTGGKLKTLGEKDKESLQAQWINCDDVLNSKINIRASDMFKLIERGRKHRSQTAIDKLPSYLPCINGHKHLLLRPVLVLREPSGPFRILMNSREGDHLPTAIISPQEFCLDTVLFRFMQNVFVLVKAPLVYGVVGLEYSGKPPHKNDGICLSVLMELNQEHVKKMTLLQDRGYHWQVLENQEILTELEKRLDRKFCVAISSV